MVQCCPICEIIFFSSNRQRNANLAQRGIDGNDMEAQVKEIEARGKVLLEEYKAQRGDKPITRTEQLEILEPLAGAFTLMSNAINMSGTKVRRTQCGNLMILLSFRSYVKSILENLEVLKLPLLPL